MQSQDTNALLFPNFLTDTNEYQQAENLLVDLWKDVESVEEEVREVN